MDVIILVGHGSPKKDANRMDIVGKILHGMMHPGCVEENCVKVCYLQFEQPDLMTAIREAATHKPERIIIHPYFLNAGAHVTKDIPGITGEARALYPEIEFIQTEPLGMAQEIVGVAKDRIEAAKGEISPGIIEKRSFGIIAKEAESIDAGLLLLSGETGPVVQRVVHATGDFEFMDTLMFHPDAVRAGIEAIRSGMDMITDVEMARAGINKKRLSGFGGKVLCGIGTVEGEDPSRTRAERAFCELAAREPNAGIYIIGNAPTALFAVGKLISEGALKPKLVIGVPVGFVRAVEAKAFLASLGEKEKLPFITNAGRKGGSTVAAAIANALLLMADENFHGRS